MQHWIVYAAAGLVLGASLPAIAGSDTGIGKGVSPHSRDISPAEHQQIGRITGIDASAMTFGCHWRNGDFTYQTNPKTSFGLGGARGSFSDLKPGAVVQVLFHFVGTTRVADAVMISS